MERKWGWTCEEKQGSKINRDGTIEETSRELGSLGREE